MKNQLIIFDFDGVLVYTERTTFEFYQKLLPRYGIHLKESDFKYKAGRKSIDFFRDVLGDKFEEKLVEEVPNSDVLHPNKLNRMPEPEMFPERLCILCPKLQWVHSLNNWVLHRL